MRSHLFMRLAVSAALASLMISTGLAQTTGLPIPGVPVTAQFPASLKQYLGLSDDQVQQITTLNQQLTQAITTKAQRQVQLQLEITQETSRPNLDAMAIGTRYAELEQIRRDIEAERTTTVASMQNILTEVQKGKLAALQHVFREYPIACAAIGQNLITVPTGAAVNPNVNNQIPSGIIGSFASFLLAPSPACPVPTAASRIGFGFVPVPVPPQP
jgi:hypothetical protein